LAQLRRSGAGGLGDQLGADILAQQARIEHDVVLMHLGGVAVEVGGDELAAALVAQTDALRRLLDCQAQP
jgi:hypothetical protein